MLFTLSTLLLSMHLLAMNVASIGPLLGIWLHERGRRGDTAAFDVGRQLSRWALGLLVVGVAIGGLLLGVRWVASDRGYLETLARLPLPAFAYAGGELLFSTACLGVFAGMWDRWRHRPWLHGLWAVLASTNLLYHFPPLMVVLGKLTVRPELALEAVVTRDVIRPLLVHPEILSQVIHFGIASLAVSGLATMELAARRHAATAVGHAEPLDRLIQGGATIALAASLLQIGSGIWVLLELPRSARNGLIGNDWWATGLFGLALVGTFAALQMLSTVALGATAPRRVHRVVVLVIGIVLVMTGLLQWSRSMQRIDRLAVTAPPVHQPWLAGGSG